MRPRRIQLDLGEVSLMGFPKEVADSLQEYIENFNKSAVPPVETFETMLASVKNPPQDLPVEVVAKDLSTMPYRAVGLSVHENKYKVVTVAFNLDTKEAAVVDFKVTDGKADGINKFKCTASDLRFV